MKISANYEPCYLFEALELVISYVNEIPVEQLCGSGEFAIPQEDVAILRSEACSDIDRDDQLVQFYFRSIATKYKGYYRGRGLCIASHILYSCLTEFFPDTEDQIQSMINHWNSIQRPYTIVEMDNYCLTIDTAKEMTSLATELSKLPIGLSVQNQFMDVIYNFEQHLHTLTGLLTPVIEKLRVLLAPWVKQAEPLLAQWNTFFNGPDASLFFEKRAGIKGLACEKMILAIRYFPAVGGYMKALPPSGPCCMLCGLDMKTEVESPLQDTLSDTECKLLQLMSNPDRISMLRVMASAPKCGQDLVRELGLHTGVVFRDLNNMARAGLLIREANKGKGMYQTNVVTIRNLANRILQVFDCECTDT